MSRFPFNSFTPFAKIAFSQPWQHLSSLFQCSCTSYADIIPNMWYLCGSNNSMSLPFPDSTTTSFYLVFFLQITELAWFVEVLEKKSVTNGELYMHCFDNVFCTGILFGSRLLQIELLVDFVSDMWRNFLHSKQKHPFLESSLDEVACSFYILYLSCCNVVLEHSKQG